MALTTLKKDFTKNAIEFSISGATGIAIKAATTLAGGWSVTWLKAGLCGVGVELVERITTFCYIKFNEHCLKRNKNHFTVLDGAIIKSITITTCALVFNIHVVAICTLSFLPTYINCGYAFFQAVKMRIEEVCSNIFLENMKKTLTDRLKEISNLHKNTNLGYDTSLLLNPIFYMINLSFISDERLHPTQSNINKLKDPLLDAMISYIFSKNINLTDSKNELEKTLNEIYPEKTKIVFIRYVDEIRKKKDLFKDLFVFVKRDNFYSLLINKIRAEKNFNVHEEILNKTFKKELNQVSQDNIFRYISFTELLNKMIGINTKVNDLKKHYRPELTISGMLAEKIFG